MYKIPKIDLFSLEDKESITTKRLSDEIILDNSFSSLKIPNYFNKQIETFSKNKQEYIKEIKKASKYIMNKSSQYGYPNSIYTAFYESVLNAHQHGNLCDSNKKVIIGSNINKDKLEIIVADEAKQLPEMFLPFILQLRNNKKGDFINWYKYSGKIKNTINLGTGTSFMHMYMDEVKYFISEDTNGLAVYMSKNLE